MNITDLNIKLLLAFEALLIHQSVTLAADSVGLSQPALSVSLRRLRELFNDALFVRTSTGMEPTPRAQELKTPILEALNRLREAVNHSPEFDPSQSNRTFHLAMTDIGSRVFLPPLLNELSRIAPNINLNTVQLPTKNIKDALESGEMDLAFGFIQGLFADSYQQNLFSRSYVCLVRRDHPVIGSKISLEEYLSMPHAVVSAAGSGHGVIEDVLSKRGYQRRVALHLSHFLAIPLIIASTNLIVTIPTMLAESYASASNIKILQPPIKFPEYTVAQYWHARYHNDSGNRWLRELTYQLFRDSGSSFKPEEFELGL